MDRSKNKTDCLVKGGNSCYEKNELKYTRKGNQIFKIKDFEKIENSIFEFVPIDLLSCAHALVQYDSRLSCVF